MFLDFHTHKVTNEPGVLEIYNVMLSRETMGITSWDRPVSMGVHPWHISADWEELLGYLETAAAWPVVRCIGEAGFDALRGGSMALQEEVFVRQLRIAEAVGKAVVVHCVRAYQELLAVGRKHSARVPLVIHGFNRKPELAHQLLKAGFFLSYGREILHQPGVQQALISTPAHRLFLETDGREGVAIQDIYARAAALRQIPVEELQEQIHQNYSKL